MTKSYRRKSGWEWGRGGEDKRYSKKSDERQELWKDRKWVGGFLSVRGDSSCSVMSDLKICLRDVFGIVLRFSPSTKTSYAGSEESETNFCSNPIHDDREWVCSFFSNH